MWAEVLWFVILLAGATGLHTVACEPLAQGQARTGCIRTEACFDYETVWGRVEIHIVHGQLAPKLRHDLSKVCHGITGQQIRIIHINKQAY